jgi:hypothetical protein
VGTWLQSLAAVVNLVLLKDTRLKPWDFRLVIDVHKLFQWLHQVGNVRFQYLLALSEVLCLEFV